MISAFGVDHGTVSKAHSEADKRKEIALRNAPGTVIGGAAGLGAGAVAGQALRVPGKIRGPLPHIVTGTGAAIGLAPYSIKQFEEQRAVSRGRRR